MSSKYPSIAFLQTRIVVAIALCVGLTLGLVEICTTFVDFRQAQQRLADQVIHSYRKPADRAAYTYDKILGKEIAEGLLNIESITRVVLLADKIETLVDTGKPAPESDLPMWFVDLLDLRPRMVTVHLFEPTDPSKPIGQLWVTVSQTQSLGLFWGLAKKILLGELIRSIILALILLLVLNRSITKPLLRLARAFSTVDPDNPKANLLPPSNIYRVDEFQQVVAAGNRLLETMGNHLEERRAKTDALSRAKQEAEASNRAKSEFLAGMSHELRTPLNAVLGYSQMLEMGVQGELNKDQQTSVAAIVDGGRQLLSLVDDVLDLARIEADHITLEVEVFNANDIVKTCIDGVSKSCAARGITVIDHFSGSDPVMIRSDRTRLIQGISNLLSNAEKYNWDNGSIVIEGSVIESGYLRLTIADTGIGIAPGSRERIFNLFTKVHESAYVAGGGVGIGLAVTRRLIERLGGWIDFKSEVGMGTTFWIAVPLASNEDALIWNNDLKVGIDVVDRDHQLIFASINKLARVILSDKDAGSVINDILVQTKTYFLLEQAIAEALGDDRADAHRKEHESHLSEIRKLFDDWRVTGDQQSLQFIRHTLDVWWRRHVQEYDKPLGELAEGKDSVILRVLRI